MNVYIYQAALYCEPCGQTVLRDLAISPGAESEDSDEMPQGPYANGGGEADCPQHCDRCGVFLENPLTADGYAYVRERLSDLMLVKDCALEIWAEFYGIELDDEQPCRDRDCARHTELGGSMPHADADDDADDEPHQCDDDCRSFGCSDRFNNARAEL